MMLATMKSESVSACSIFILEAFFDNISTIVV